MAEVVAAAAAAAASAAVGVGGNLSTMGHLAEAGFSVAAAAVTSVLVHQAMSVKGLAAAAAAAQDHRSGRKRRKNQRVVRNRLYGPRRRAEPELLEEGRKSHLYGRAKRRIQAAVPMLVA